MTISIRILSDADFQTADVILASAFQRAESWRTELRLFRHLQPDGLFLASMDGTPAGMVVAINYSDYAYVGLMGIHQNFQRRGLGNALMQHVLNWASEQNIPLVKLDASKAGQPLYEKLGFVLREEVYVLQRQTGSRNEQVPGGVQLLRPPHLDRIASFDTEAFGSDRTRLLRALLEIYPGRAFLSQDQQGKVHGYLFAQAERIGPWIMQESGDAEQLLLAALSLPFAKPVSVIAPANNASALSLLQRHGFQINRVNRHMTSGSAAIEGLREKVYGQTSLSFG